MPNPLVVMIVQYLDYTLSYYSEYQMMCVCGRDVLMTVY